MSSRRRARGDWKAACKLNARLASRESDIIAAAVRADVSAEPLVPEDLYGFVLQRIEAERPGWQRGDPASIPVLFQSEVERPEGRSRILVAHDPIVRLVWAGKRPEAESWLVALLLSLELVATDRFSKSYLALSAYWTMMRDGEGWRIERVESGADGQHYLTDPLADQVSDREIHDEATISTAVDSVASAEPPAAELVDIDATTHSRLLDLSVVDGRYGPEVIAACVREIARAWESATFARDRTKLEAWCTAAAAAQLLHPTPHGLRRVEKLETRRVQIDALHTDVEPPTVNVTLQVHGQRWLATDSGTKLSGSRTRCRDFTEHWTLRLDPSPTCPWRLIDVHDPGRP